MLDGPSCLISVSRCDTLLEQEQGFVVQWLLPRVHLHDVKTSNPVEARKMGRRRAKSKKISKSTFKALDVEVMPESGGSTGTLISFQKDGVMEGTQESAMEVCEEGSHVGCSDVTFAHVGCTGVSPVYLGCPYLSAAPDECSTSHGEKDDEMLHDAEAVDTSYLPGLDDAVALRCLAFLPRMHHWRIALLSRRHYDLIRSSLLFKLQREYHILEQWICIYTTGNNGWTAFDPKNNTWRNLPHAVVDSNFESSDKESLSAGTHLMWLGREVFDFACYKYDLVSNSWERGPVMVNPRCLFASATCGKFAFVAGGFSVGGLQFNVLNSAERYDSSRGVWEPLPPMATPRHRCSGFFMDGKFYVIGGKTMNHEPLTSGEEFDPERNVWRTIEDMYCALDASRSPNASPPLVAVAGNELYTIESSSNLLKVYEKQTNTWRVLGQVPVRADFCNGWGLAFKALGDELFVIGGHRMSTQDREGVAVFSWRPTPGASFPEWQLVNLRMAGIGNFLFNCAVMAC